MELNTKMSKPLVISLLVLVAVLLLAIGAAIGSHSSRYREFGYGDRACGGFDNFERGGRRGMMQGGREINVQGGRGMMYYQNTDEGGQTQVQGVIGTGVISQPAIPANATTTVK
jgi:hypothetical protein